MTMTAEETDQLAACRMRVAELHQALDHARRGLLDRSASNATVDPILATVNAALAGSEPEMLNVIEKARLVVLLTKNDGVLEDWPELHSALDALEAALPKVGE